MLELDSGNSLVDRASSERDRQSKKAAQRGDGGIDRLEESDEADVEQAWIDEVQKRARELETGQVQGLTWAEARRIMLGT